MKKQEELTTWEPARQAGVLNFKATGKSLDSPDRLS